MDADQIWRNVGQQRAELADLFDTLTADQWMAPSLCELAGADVAAHLTLSTMLPARAIIEAVKSGFRFDPMINRLGVEDPRSQTEIASPPRCAPWSAPAKSARHQRANSR